MSISCSSGVYTRVAQFLTRWLLSDSVVAGGAARVVAPNRWSSGFVWALVSRAQLGRLVGFTHGGWVLSIKYRASLKLVNNWVSGGVVLTVLSGTGCVRVNTA